MKYRVLISEDEPGITIVYKKELESDGRFLVRVALDGLTAQSLLEAEPFDLVILDLMTPKITGGELLKKIKKKQPWTPCIIVSGKGTEKDKLEALNEHAFKYLEKPAPMEKIIGAVEEALKGRDWVLKAVEKIVRDSQNPQNPMIRVGERTLSAQELFDEVRLGTSTGKAYRQSFEQFVMESSQPSHSIEPLSEFGLMDC